MDSRPPNVLLLLLLTTLLHFYAGRCAGEQSSYTIDTVRLAISPSNTIPSGNPVSIVCQVSVSHGDIANLTHTFQLKRDDVLIHSSTTTDDTVAYELNPARAADSGNYECRVTVKDKSRSSYIQKLDVTGLQTPVLRLSNTTLYESEEFTATCSAPEEKGSLVFRFYQRFRSGEIQRLKQLAPKGNSSETTLVLRLVGDSFLYCDYEINLVSGPRRSNRSAEIHVIVKGLYISPIMNVLPSPDVYEGDVLEVVCKVVSPPKTVEVFLKKNRSILKQAQISLNHRFTAQDGDSGELVCKAEWGNVQKETYQAITVKELFSKPQLKVEPADIFEGDHFKLSCSVSVYVPDRINKDRMLFSIYKDNVKVASSDSFITVANSSKNGNYTCKAEASSLSHSFVKESQTVVVKAKVPVSKPVLSVVGGTLVLGKPFQLICRSGNGTLPIVYNLWGPKKMVQTKVVNKPGERAIFNASAINAATDIDNFLCHANNNRRREAEQARVQRWPNIIEPVSRPVLRIHPSMGDVSEGQEVTLVCSVQEGTLPVRFTWFNTKTEGSLVSKTSMEPEDSHKIANVRKEHQGGYYCVSTNQANEAKQSMTVTIRVTMAGWKKGLIAALCILLILALILVIVFKRRLRRFKRKATAELSVKLASTKVERLSLTQAEVNEAANATPGMMGKSVWSEHVSGSDCKGAAMHDHSSKESDDQHSVTSPQKPEPQYSEVQTKQADPNRAPVKKGTDTVYSEVRCSRQGVPEPAEGQGSVEYAQLNHDADHHGDHSVQDDRAEETDNTADQGEWEHDPAPDCD